jgi:predicted DNA-binding transcriptional regulator YafY
MALDWPDEVPGRLLAMGADLEVLEPPDIRDRIIEMARAVVGAYR